MIFRVLGLSLILFATGAQANRKPAVEDFVGIEVEETEVIPPGSESLYNLQNDMSNIETVKSTPTASHATETISKDTSWSATTWFGLSLIAGLPVIIWLLLMSHLKKKATQDSASNIEVLEKYRKERERKNEEKIKKAS